LDRAITPKYVAQEFLQRLPLHRALRNVGDKNHVAATLHVARFLQRKKRCNVATFFHATFGLQRLYYFEIESVMAFSTSLLATSVFL